MVEFLIGNRVINGVVVNGVAMNSAISICREGAP